MKKTLKYLLHLWRWTWHWEYRWGYRQAKMLKEQHPEFWEKEKNDI